MTLAGRWQKDYSLFFRRCLSFFLWSWVLVGQLSSLCGFPSGPFSKQPFSPLLRGFFHIRDKHCSKTRMLEFGIKNSHCRLVSMKQPFIAHNSHHRSLCQVLSPRGAAQPHWWLWCCTIAFPSLNPFVSSHPKLTEYVCSSRGVPQHSQKPHQALCPITTS